MDRVFMDLSLEGIRAHPIQYLLMSLRSTLGLFRHGLTFSYPIMPLRETADINTRFWFYKSWAFNAHSPVERIALPAGFVPLNPRSVTVITPEVLSGFATTWFKAFLLASAALLGFVALVGGSQPGSLRWVSVFCVLIGTYLPMLGFVAPGEPPRYLEPVQDIIVAGVLGAFLIGWRSLVAKRLDGNGTLLLHHGATSEESMTPERKVP
jgi:hypothetical protein